MDMEAVYFLWSSARISWYFSVFSISFLFVFVTHGQLHSITFTVFDIWSITTISSLFPCSTAVSISAPDKSIGISQRLYTSSVFVAGFGSMPLFGCGIVLMMPNRCNNAKNKHFKTLLWRYSYSVRERSGYPNRSCRSFSGFVWQRRHKLVLTFWSSFELW